MLLLSLAVLLSIGSKPALTVPQEARMLRLKRGSLISQVWKESDRLRIDSGYTNRTLGQHTIVSFPFGNGDELLFSTWGGESLQRLTYWRRRDARLSRVCQLTASDNGGTFSQWIKNGGKGMQADAPSALRTFLLGLRPCVSYCFNPGADELGCEVILMNGKTGKWIEAGPKESGGKLKGSWCETNGGPPLCKQELQFLKKRRKV